MPGQLVWHIVNDLIQKQQILGLLKGLCKNTLDTMVDEVGIYFAGLARDCEGVLESNLMSLVEICDHPKVKDCEIWIAENDSTDDTREILERYEIKYDCMNLYLFDNLDTRFPRRETRIAHLRQFLLEKIRNQSADHNSEIPYLYVPIDLDSNIANSIDRDQFVSECLRVASGETEAVFPVSKPYYYDIYALRAQGWVEADCWDQVKNSKKRLGTLRSRVKHIYSNQKKIENLQNGDRIPVQSAFGGVGIYNITAITDANYRRDDEDTPSKVCEHVIFNESVDEKEISTEFVVQAPEEHILYKTSALGKAKIAVRSILIDMKNLIETVSGKLREGR